LRQAAWFNRVAKAGLAKGLERNTDGNNCQSCGRLPKTFKKMYLC
jgi:ribosomal protein S14